MKTIVIIEPAYGDNVHFPFNASLLRTVADTYTSANVIFIGGSGQNKLIASTLPNHILIRCEFRDWDVYGDRDTSPENVIIRLFNLAKVGARAIFNADLLILTSVTGTALTALQIIPRKKNQKLQIFLHGNLNDLEGWRSRNPFRRIGDLHAAIRRAALSNTQFIVLEEHIRFSAGRKWPWIAEKLQFFPHPIIVEESITHSKTLGAPIKIGLAGISSPDKGFAQFRELAHRMKANFPGGFEFHSIGKRHQTNKDSDFEFLDTCPSEKQLERAEFLSQLDKMHFLFFWPTGEYYNNASSGVFYDAINRKVPILSKVELKFLQPEIESMGVISNSVENLADTLSKIGTSDYAIYIDGLTNYSERLQPDALVVRFRHLVDSFNEKPFAGAAITEKNLEISPSVKKL